MGILSDFYERLLRRFQKKPSSRQSSIKRTQSLPREHKDRATIVVRPRSNTTEVTIERRRVSSRTDWNKINKSVDKQEVLQTETGKKKERTRAESTTVVISRTEKKTGGSILAPTYKQSNNHITISI